MADKVLDPELMKYLRDNPVRKSAFILAGGNEHFAGINPIPRPRSQFTYAYTVLPLTLTQVYAGRIAQMCGATDHVVTDATACASSLKVMMDVQTLINYYGFERVCVLAVEDNICNLTLGFFADLNVTLLQNDDDAGKLPSAFDSTNGGFHIGQGAAFAVFESGAVSAHAYLDGAYTASELYGNQLGQDPNGTGFIKAMDGALEFAMIDPAEIRVVKTHGTGTTSNNEAERAALEAVLANDFVATSFKPTIGHTLGVSGLLETCLLVDSLKTGIVPAIKNRTEEDRIYLSEPAQAEECTTFMSLAAGMGNVYSAAIFTVGP
jgi:3-oxoacyl-(acyl-carrier-protein) synthase